MIDNERAMTLEALPDEAKRLFEDGYRLVTATCLDQNEDFEIIYHFDRGGQLLNLRMLFPKSSTVPSITGSYLAAFLIENEIGELFGVDFSGVAVSYAGRLLTTEDAPQRPMLKSYQVTSVAARPNGGE